MRKPSSILLAVVLSSFAGARTHAQALSPSEAARVCEDAEARVLPEREVVLARTTRRLTRARRLRITGFSLVGAYVLAIGLAPALAQEHSCPPDDTSSDTWSFCVDRNDHLTAFGAVAFYGHPALAAGLAMLGRGFRIRRGARDMTLDVASNGFRLAF